MSVARLTRLLPIGAILLAAGLGLHLWTHGDFSESISGFLIGIGVVFIIAGFANRFFKQPDSARRT
ncbi:MAG TPA: hypothetical protein VKB49_28525 [Candidatus Sulfotelmatobacter sp.]|nr:hypothetical protein [Candidatus Sulfotelmatobacter sp.]